ncbi:hypothetical protein Fmac_032119 [Flemingia macrophylla]|uniref:Uncharacterized protein n=1 Tax=Flemingia macrophylla TaxID=520843 RepID=A0ABD1L4E4_9FABA
MRSNQSLVVVKFKLGVGNCEVWVTMWNYDIVEYNEVIIKWIGTKMVKKSLRQVKEKYCSCITLNLHTDKKVLEEMTLITLKRLQ